jgi:hypothetical protein
MASVGSSQPSIGKGVAPGGSDGQALVKQSAYANDLSWTDAYRRIMSSTYLNTSYYDNRVMSVSPSTLVMVVNTVYCIPFWAAAAIPVATLGGYISSASTTGSLSVGISSMSATGIAPGTLLYSGSVTSTVSLGFQVTLPGGASIPAGWSWFSIVATTQSCSIAGHSANSIAAVPITYALNNGSTPVSTNVGMYSYSGSVLVSDPTVAANGGNVPAMTFKPS